MEKSTDPSLKNANRTSYFIRLFQGEISLPITYWFFGVLIGVIVLGIFLDLVAYGSNKISFPYRWWLSLGFVFVVIVYNLFIIIAIWRSAGKYRGKVPWGGIARLSLIVTTLATIGAVMTELTQGRDSELQEELALMNKGLPTILDNNTRMDSVSMDGRDVRYSYTLINETVGNMDLSRFVAQMPPKLRVSTCKAETTRLLLRRGATG